MSGCESAITSDRGDGGGEDCDDSTDNDDCDEGGRDCDCEEENDNTDDGGLSGESEHRRCFRRLLRRPSCPSPWSGRHRLRQSSLLKCLYHGE